MDGDGTVVTDFDGISPLRSFETPVRNNRPLGPNPVRTYDSGHNTDEEGAIYLKELSGRHYDDFLSQIEGDKEKSNAINVYQNVSQCDIMHKALDLGQLPLFNRVSRQLNSTVYSKLIKSPGEKFAIDFILSKTTVPDYEKTVEVLDKIFEMVPETPAPMITYRCYANFINLELASHLFDDPPSPIISTNKRYISTSLSRELVDKWCKYGDTKFKLCILIPKGSRGVLPLLLFKKENFRQNEITLPRTSALKFSGEYREVEGYNYPVFVYVKNKAEPIDKYLAQIRAKDYNLVRPENEPDYAPAPVPVPAPARSMFSLTRSARVGSGKRKTKRKRHKK